MGKRFAAELKRLEELRATNLRVPASAIIDQLRGSQVAPPTPGERGTVALSSATPAALGAAAPGSAGTASDGGHVHAHGDLSAAGGTMHSPAQAGAEPALGNPASSGYVLSSTTAGARSWVAQGGDVGAAIHAATAKTTPVDADETALIDSAASYGLKRLTWSNIKATLKSYFDTLYAALVHKSRHATGGADALSPTDIGAATTAANTFSAAQTVDVATDASGAYIQEWRSSGGAVLRAFVDDLGQASWYLQGAGQIAYTTPGSEVALLMRDASATARSDIRHLAGGGFVFAVGSGATPAEAMRIEDTRTVLIGRTTGLTGAGDLDVSGRIRGDTIETAGGSQWKLAGRTADATDRVSNGYVTVTIDGTNYKLMTRA